jgi:uncharacterized protein YdeI (YjbR/CyaY-like superfamily)
MGKKDPRIDAYIAKSADFAKPILTEIRTIVHDACPDVEETMKWSFPHFGYKGMMCSMASFKEHCAFGFWKASLILDGNGAQGAMGQFGRIMTLSDLPSKKVMRQYIQKAMALNDSGTTVKREPKAPKKPIPVPADFNAAVKKNKKALAAFEAFSPSHRREYLEWITEARSDDTRKRRIGQAIEWMAAGKPRNWKYEPKKSQKARARARAS